MGLFGTKNKKDETSSCCNAGDFNKERPANADKASRSGVSVKILGSGCAKCNQLEAAAKAAMQQLGMDADIEHVTDFSQIAAYGVMTTPALVVDEKVVSFGKMLKPEEIVKIFRLIKSS